MTDRDMYASFFIRLSKIVVESSSAQEAKVLFEVEHIQSGEVCILDTQEAFFEFFQSFTNRLTGTYGPD